MNDSTDFKDTNTHCGITNKPNITKLLNATEQVLFKMVNLA